MCSTMELKMTVAMAELVDGCRLKCTLCYNNIRTPSFRQMELSMLEKFITKYLPWRKGYTNWGEPLLHTEFLTIAEMIKGTNSDLHSSFSLNIPDSYFEVMNNFKRIDVSLSGITQDVYGLYHKGGDCGLVLNNIRKLSEAIGKDTRVIIHFLIHKDNEHQYEEAVDLFADMQFLVEAVRTWYQIEGMLEGFAHPYLKGKEYHYRRGRFNCKEVRNPKIDVNGNHLLCCATRNVKIGFTLDDDVPEELLIETKMKHPLCQKCQETQHWRMIRGHII